jgi:pimeloyl-ACP methyl ester carboxylesterase
MASIEAPALAGVARTDERTGVRERVGFLGRPPDQLFAALYEPPAPARAAVVICPSILADLTHNYRREVALSRALAARGVAAARFHYRGTGNSHGEPSAVTFETLVDDARTAAALLGSRSRCRAAFLGTRVGALVAAAAAGDAPLVLWEPVTDGTGYWREAFRAQRIRDLTRTGRPGPDPERALADVGWTDLLGHRVHDALYRSLRERTLGAGRRVLTLDTTADRRGWWFNPAPGLDEVDVAAERICSWL